MKARLLPVLVIAAWLGIELGMTLASHGGPLHP